MKLKEILMYIWGTTWAICFSVAVGILIQPKLGRIFELDFALGVWSLAMVITAAIWMLSYGVATLWELNIIDAIFDPKSNPSFSLVHVILPLILALAFALLVSHSWKLHIALPVAIIIAYADLIGNFIIMKGIFRMLLNNKDITMSDSERILQKYFLEKHHFYRIILYQAVLYMAFVLAVLSLGDILFKNLENQAQYKTLALIAENNKVIFDRLARACFIISIWGNLIMIWWWRYSRTSELKQIGRG